MIDDIDDIDLRFNNLAMVIASGRLIKGDWADHRGVCMVAALSPEAQAKGASSATPSWLMPAWMALLTTWMNDNTVDTDPKWELRYVDLMRKACRTLTEDRWNKFYSQLLDEAAQRVERKEAINVTSKTSRRETASSVRFYKNHIDTGIITALGIAMRFLDMTWDDTTVMVLDQLEIACREQ